MTFLHTEHPDDVRAMPENAGTCLRSKDTRDSESELIGPYAMEVHATFENEPVRTEQLVRFEPATMMDFVFDNMEIAGSVYFLMAGRLNEPCLTDGRTVVAIQMALCEMMNYYCTFLTGMSKM